MTATFAASTLPIACASSRDNVPKPLPVTGDASDGLRRDDSQEIPCEPRRVLVTICQQCHTRPKTKNGAPFPLQWRSDLMASYTGVQIRVLMIEELSAGRMPLSPVTIESADRETLLAWLRAGAPAVAPTTCTDAGADDVDAASDAGADGSATGADAEADAGTDAIDGLDAGDEADAEEDQ